MTINSKMYACVLAAAALVLATAENPAFLSKHPKGRELLSSVEWTALGPMQKFALWKEVFQPQYETDTHESAAFASFKYNDAIIEAHNDDTSSSYRLGHNEFSDLSLEEFHSRMGLKIPVTKLRSRKRNVDTTLRVTSSTPSSVDWVEKGAVTDVKNQGQCGSCWSFSTTGAVEGAYYINEGSLISLSEQQLVSCDKTDSGCDGGMMDYAFSWIKSNGGICEEADYEYTSSEGTAASCKSTCTPVVTVTGYTDVTENDEDAMKAAVAQQPVSVAIEADTSAFQLYESGVFTSSSCGTDIDHGVLVVGYGTDDDTDYWKVKNSWGSSWGESGYIRLERGVNMCGIASLPSYPKGATKASTTLVADKTSLFEDAMRSIFGTTTPSGTYKGSKSVLGQSITATITIEDDSHFDFAISGAASIDCDDESFTLDGGKFDVPGATTSGDCLYEALNKNNVELSSVTYDATSDEITVNVKYEGFLTLSVVLDKQSTNTVSALASTLFSLYADTTPSGTYKGSKSVLGQSVTATIKFEDDSHFDFAISGAASIDCDDESFTLDGGKFNVPGATTSGDCLYEALNKNNVELSSVTYDATSDEITVDVKYEGFLTLSVVLDKQ